MAFWAGRRYLVYRVGPSAGSKCALFSIVQELIDSFSVGIVIISVISLLVRSPSHVSLRSTEGRLVDLVLRI